VADFKVIIEDQALTDKIGRTTTKLWKFIWFSCDLLPDRGLLTLVKM